MCIGVLRLELGKIGPNLKQPKKYKPETGGEQPEAEKSFGAIVEILIVQRGACKSSRLREEARGYVLVDLDALHPLGVVDGQTTQDGKPKCVVFYVRWRMRRCGDAAMN